MSVAEVRALLRARPRRRPSAGDVYTAVALVGLGGLELYSLLSAPGRSFGEFATPASALWAGAALDPALGGTALIVTMLAGLYALLRRIGPTLVSRAQLSWLLPLPIDRRGLLAPSLARTLLATVLAAGSLAALLTSALFGMISPLFVALAASVGIGLAAVLVGLSSAVQMAGSPRARAADAAARVASPLALIVLLLMQFAAVLVGWPQSGLQQSDLSRAVTGGAAAMAAETAAETAAAAGVPGALAAVTVLLLLTASGLLARSFCRLGRLGSAELRRSAGSAGELWSALLSMSFPETEAERRAPRAAVPAASRWRLPRAIRPAGALVHAQVLVWWRSSATLPVLLSSALVPAALLAIPVLNLRWILVVILVVSALRAVTAASGPARLMAENGALGRLLPISERAQRRLFGILPALILMPWAFIALGLLVIAGAAPAGALWLAAPLAAGLAGSTVRSAFRPDPDWSSAGIPTEMGIIPTGWFISALHGRMATVVVLGPVMVMVVTASVSPALVAAQLMISAAVVWHGTRA